MKFECLGLLGITLASNVKFQDMTKISTSSCKVRFLQQMLLGRGNKKILVGHIARKGEMNGIKTFGWNA